MEIYSKLIKPIAETKYLNTENSWRYRPTLRFFYLQYEKLKYWMYKEEIYEQLKEHDMFNEYTMEQCRQDLDVLVEWGNLIPVQDTSKVSTVEEFKNKQFRYQLSEYSVEIERLTLKLENLMVEGASLEPSLFERIKDSLVKIDQLTDEDIKTVGAWWRDLNADFKRLNQNYQDYIRSFHSLKAEEMMKTKEFIAYKDSIIEYLREFVKGLQQTSYKIEETLKNTDEKTVQKVLGKVFEHEKSIPRIDVEVSHDQILENIIGRWTNLNNWFLGSGNGESEVVKLFDMTNEIIRKITRFASQIAETHNNAANRKEEYKKLCNMFLECKDIDEAHQLSSLAFGIFNTRHIKASIIRTTESINSGVYDEQPLEVETRPRIRTYREKSNRNPIEDKSKRKKEMLAQYIKEREQEEKIINSYIEEGTITFNKLPIIQSHVRTTLLKWIAKGVITLGRWEKTEDGREFKVIFPKNGERCILKCEDGNLDMPAFVIKFKSIRKEEVS